MCADILKDLAQGRQPPPDDVVTSLNAVYANAEREGGAGLPTERVAEVVKSILEALKRRKTTREYEYLQYCAQLVRSLPRARTQTHPGILIGLCKTVTGTVNRVQCKITTRNQWLELLCAYIDAMESMANNPILVQKMGQKARVHMIEHFSWATVAKQHRARYENLLVGQEA